MLCYGVWFTNFFYFFYYLQLFKRYVIPCFFFVERFVGIWSFSGIWCFGYFIGSFLLLHLIVLSYIWHLVFYCWVISLFLFFIEGYVVLWALGKSQVSDLVRSISEFLLWSRITGYKLLTALECRNHKRFEGPNWRVNSGESHSKGAFSVCWSVQFKELSIQREFP